MVRHGSLSRAGKVKNATPVQGRADKNKIDSGRAKKRKLYNARFNGGGSNGSNGQKQSL